MKNNSLNPRIELFPGGIYFMRERWEGELAVGRFFAVVGAPTRVEVKLANNVLWRRILVYDQLGIYAVEDVAENRIGYLGIALVPEYTSFPPRIGFAGELIVNGTSLVAKMTKKEIPLKGELNFVSGIGSTLKCVHDNGYVELNFKRLKSPPLRRGPPVLVSVTHSFLRD